MSAAHTPGPWMVEVGTNHLWVGPEKAVGGKVGDVVVGLECGPDYRLSYSDKQEANARLIAAAPDLLEALKEAQQNWHHMIGLSSPAEHHRLNERMSAAIAKATGDTGQ